MIRILHIIADLDTGGAETMLFKLLSAMDRGRFEAKVVSLLDRGALAEKIEGLGVPVHELGSRGLPRLPVAVWRLVRIVHQARPDLVQGWMYHGNLAAALAGRMAGAVPVLWNVRQSLAELAAEKPMTGAIIRLGARLSEMPIRILYNSRVAARQHEVLGYRADRTCVISNGFDTWSFKPDREGRAALRHELGIDEWAPVIGLMARFHPMKDHENFLRAAALVQQSYPTVRFVLAGRGVERGNSELVSLVERLSLNSSVLLLGERTDVSRLTAAVDVAVNCSWRGEAFPNAVGEAMACGVPCVVTDVGDSAWVVGETGKVVAPRDPQALAGALRALLDAGPEARRALGLAARRRIEEYFSLKQIATQYATLYEECLAKRMA